jgi:transcriptional regulator with XRE-family HTH domain
MGKRFAENLKIIRKALGKKQTEVAEGANVNYRHYQSLESDSANVKLSTGIQIAQSLAIPACYLYQEEVDKSLLKADVLCPTELINLLPAGILIVGLDGKILYSNEFFRSQLTYYKKSDFKNGLFVWDLIWGSEEDKAHGRELFHSVTKHRPEPTYAKRTYMGPDFQPLEVSIAWNYVENKRGSLCHYVSVVIPTFTPKEKLPRNSPGV